MEWDDRCPCCNPKVAAWLEELRQKEIERLTGKKAPKDVDER